MSALLNSNNIYEMYMEQLREFEEGDNHIWRLRKTLYGTIQGAHDWAKNLDRTFKGHEYYKSKADPQICSRVYDNELTLTSTWIDVLGTFSTFEDKILAKS